MGTCLHQMPCQVQEDDDHCISEDPDQKRDDVDFLHVASGPVAHIAEGAPEEVDAEEAPLEKEQHNVDGHFLRRRAKET